MVANALERAEHKPANDDLLAQIRQTRIDRDMAIAEHNEIEAGLFKGSFVYVSDTTRIVGADSRPSKPGSGGYRLKWLAS